VPFTIYHLSKRTVEILVTTLLTLLFIMALADMLAEQGKASETASASYKAQALLLVRVFFAAAAALLAATLLLWAVLRH
jgi:hypothetical protein